MLLSPSSKIRSYLQGRELSGLPPPSCGEGLGVGSRELWLQTRPYSHRAKHLGRHDHLGLVPPLIQLEKRSGEFRREQKPQPDFRPQVDHHSGQMALDKPPPSGSRQ